MSPPGLSRGGSKRERYSRSRSRDAPAFPKLNYGGFYVGKASRERGKRGERRWRDTLRDEGFQAERTGWKQSSGGGDDVPDVQSDDLRVHFEVKNVKTFRCADAIEQALEDANGKPVAVAWLRDRKEALVIMPASHWFQAIRGDLLVENKAEQKTENT